MEAQENPTYLHVNPYCNDRQVIHIESILGSNVVILGIFSCKNDSSSNKVEVEKIEFEIYPMDGLFSWGFKKIIPQLDSDVKNNKIREIKIVLGTTNMKPKMTIICKGVSWEHDDIIDNKMYFNVLGKEFDRKELKEIFENKSITSNDFNNIPVAGRPCQFKLVSPM